MECFKCVCDEDLNKNTFKKHFKNCLQFKDKFIDIDFKISILLKNYNPLLIKNYLSRYIKLINSKFKKLNINKVKDINNN